ncbi:hypothetical protein Tco_0448929 [Tanacetum coccineum]
MSTNEQTPLSQPTSIMLNTLGKEQISQDMDMLASEAALREYCDRNYHQLLPIIAEKVHQEKHSESGTPSGRRDLRKRLGSRHIYNVSRSPEPRHDRPKSPRKRDLERKMVFKRLEKGVFHRLGDKGKNVSTHSNDLRRQSYHNSRRDTERCYQSSCSRGTEPASEKHHNKRTSSYRMSSIKDDDLSRPWVCEETDPFTPHIRYFDLPKRTHMPSHIKTYDGSEDLEDHLKIFQAAAKVKCWAMPTWCHMFNSTLTRSARVWFDDLPPESIDSYDDLKEAFLANFRQQKKFKVESRDVKGGEVVAGNQEWRKSLPPWKQQEAGHKQNFKKGGFKNQQRSKRRQDRFTLLSKSPKEILALEKGKFKAPPPMTTLVEKRNSNKFYEFHGEVGHNTDECMHLKRQIEELLKNGKLSHVIKEL